MYWSGRLCLPQAWTRTPFGSWGFTKGGEVWFDLINIAMTNKLWQICQYGLYILVGNQGCEGWGSDVILRHRMPVQDKPRGKAENIAVTPATDPYFAWCGHGSTYMAWQCSQARVQGPLTRSSTTMEEGSLTARHPSDCGAILNQIAWQTKEMQPEVRHDAIEDKVDRHNHRKKCWTGYFISAFVPYIVEWQYLCRIDFPKSIDYCHWGARHPD